MTPRWPVTLALALLAASGCATLDRISGSGSMRIDVEVYKGPLAQDPWTQWGELRGLVADADVALGAAAGYALQINRRLPCREPGAPLDPNEPKFQKDQDCESIAGVLALANRIHSTAKLLSNLNTELKRGGLVVAGGKTPDQTRADVRDALQEVSQVAAQMRASAFFLSVVALSSPPDKRSARTALTNVAVVLSELGNQIVTRSDALLQQMVGPDRRELPLSVHIRNTNPTDFVNLYVWNRAAGLALATDMLLRFPTGFTSEETADRVRGYERLFADYNWSNVNSVYASGQGDVAMAFIKDDIGNWNLKNFSNDPTELLKSYTEVAKAALVAAADLAAKASGPGAAGDGAGKLMGSAAQLTELANRVALGRTGAPQPTVGGLDVGALHARAARELAALSTTAKERKGSLDTAIAAHDKKIPDLTTARNGKHAQAAATRDNKPKTTPGSAAEFEREAERNREQVFAVDQQITLLENEIASGAAKDDAGGTPSERLDNLKKRRQALDSTRQANVASAAAARALDRQAADIEAAALKLDAEEKTLDVSLTAEQKQRDEKEATRVALPQTMARAAREILERHQKIVELLQEGIATTAPTPGAAAPSTATPSAPIPRAPALPDALPVPATPPVPVPTGLAVPPR